MLRLHGDRATLLAALSAHWADHQLGLVSPFRRIRRPRNEDTGPAR
jgi:hypothetical protein